MTPRPLTVKRIAEVDVDMPTHRWLVEDLWGRGAVGIVGGAPKCCKSWLGLDIALSVASGTPCLGRFPVTRAGPTLVYLAEDAAPMVRERILGICNHRRLDIETLDLHLIDTPSLRLDLDADRTSLAAAVEAIRPKLLLLDPLVRLHRADENSSADISALLGFLRDLQRRFDTAVLLVHHMSKKHRAQLGQALRGSGDLHAFGDCNAYLVRKNDKLILSVEHRFAKESAPIPLALLSDDNGHNTHLEILDQSISWTMRDKNHTLTLHATRSQGGLLHAPTVTEMTNRLLESLTSTVEVSLTTADGKPLFSGTGRNAGLEVGGAIEELIALWESESGTVGRRS